MVLQCSFPGNATVIDPSTRDASRSDMSESRKIIDLPDGRDQRIFYDPKP